MAYKFAYVIFLLYLCAKIAKEVIMNTNKDHLIEAPVMDVSRTGGGQEYLTADELMSRLEPHIRSLFR